MARVAEGGAAARLGAIDEGDAPPLARDAERAGEPYDPRTDDKDAVRP
jgi:hypothetical protein